ncbi:MAG: helix-turn-helix domain-containing protein [Veillonella sp.]|uniref:helix-turn-helix domain-containing protein n=1 Tax=Veillonella sp. TaxID=1926307 RepID=UPI0025F42893|nr:helix-turn-helix domain-containing protein [Veillonella sp.]MBS4914181.1 helix-turn-helix domain-containing protein [Veillonella sp.]
MEPRPSQRIVIPEQLLFQLYVEEKQSSWMIAKKLHCSQDTIVRRLHEYRIPIRTRKLELPMDEVVTLYRKGIGVKQLAQRYQCSHTTLANRLRKAGVLRYVKSPKNTKFSPAMERRIARLYKSGQSANQIAKDLRVSRWLVLAALRRLGIRIRHSNKRIAVNVDELMYLYKVHGYSTTDLESIYNVKAGTIGERLKERGVKLRGHNLDLNAYEVCYRYDQGQSPLQIAEHFGCSYTAVRRRLEKWKRYKRVVS